MLIALKLILTKALTTMLSKAMLEWLLFWLADMAVQSTKTTKDEEWLKRFKDEYNK